jgi:hypothetical protein
MSELVKVDGKFLDYYTAMSEYFGKRVHSPLGREAGQAAHYSGIAGVVHKPLEAQEGGSHYKGLSIQPAEFSQKNALNWCEGNVVKYVCRHRDKGGKEDLLKARHYIDLLIEIEYDHEAM